MSRHVNYLMGGNSQIAEEIAQETFVRLYTSPPVTGDNLSAWLLRVATNLTYNYLKSDRRRMDRENRVYTDGADKTPEGCLPEEVFLRNQQVLAVKEVLEVLPERDRMCLLLKFSGFSYLEIAEVTGVRTNSVGKFLARAQERFRMEFVKRNGGNG